jgi:hypothetical protein
MPTAAVFDLRTIDLEGIADAAISTPGTVLKVLHGNVVGTREGDRIRAALRARGLPAPLTESLALELETLRVRRGDGRCHLTSPRAIR